MLVRSSLRNFNRMVNVDPVVNHDDQRQHAAQRRSPLFLTNLQKLRGDIEG